MMLKRYNNFINKEESLNENVAQAKKYLVDKYLKDNDLKKEDVKPEQLREIERLPDYVKIRDLVARNAGWTYVFTRFFFEDEVPFEELKALYDKLVEYKSLLNRLPKTVDRYLEPEERNGQKRTAYEDLSDDLENISRYRNYKHFLDELPAQMKHELESSGAVLKGKVENLAVEFYKLDPNLQKNFIKKLSRYRAINDLVRVLESYLKASSGQGFSDFIKKVEEVNKRLGEKHGAEIVNINEEDEKIIIELRSFEACKSLCANTSWCIAQWHSHWDSYVGGDTVYAKQYAVFDFGLSPGDNMSIVGCTINAGNKWRTGHMKNDGSITEQAFRRSLSSEENAIVVGPTAAEVEAKRRYVEASKILKKDNITIDQAKKAIADGADVNCGSGLPLYNACKTGNKELVAYYLEVGAQPNLGPDEQRLPINDAKDLEIIKMLVKNGANFTPKAFKNFVDSKLGVFNKDAVEYFLQNGMNINFEGGYALRNATRSGKIELIDYLVKNGSDPNLRKGMAFTWACEYGKPEAVDYLLKTGKIRSDVQEGGLVRGFQLAHARNKKDDTGTFKKICDLIYTYAKEKNIPELGKIEEIKKS